MIAADAAAKHGFDYSPPRPSPSPANNGSFFGKMPLSMLSSVIRRQPSSALTTPVDAPPSLADAPETPNPHKASMPAPSTTAPTLSPPTSRPVSASSTATASEKPKKRAPRAKTTYNLAQPPPTAGPRHKLGIRPKVLLQLHQVIPSRRPKPVYEVIPFSLLAPRSTRRLARTFHPTGKLGPNDLLIVKAEAYGQKDDEDKSDDERWGARDVIGVICPGKKDDKDACTKTEILLEDGTCWETACLPNGGYEFNSRDDHGLMLKSRWVPKTAHSRRVSAMSSTSLNSPTWPADDRKFNFSTISANSRRHPVIATLTRTNIDVLDSYSMPSATSPPTPGYAPSLATPLATPSSILESGSFFDKAEDRTAVTTDDALRTFIVVSGIWVAFSEGWSPAYNLSRQACPYPLTTTSSFRPAAPVRTLSMSHVDSPRSSSPASTIDENRRTLPKLLRSSTAMLRSASATSASSPTSASTKTSPVSSPIKTRSRRSNSTGNADFHPTRIGSARKRFGFAPEELSLAETEEERQSKRSIEILRIKELASTPTILPVKILEPSPEMTRSGSPSPKAPLSPKDKERLLKVQSAYNPITTAGLWDSGVSEGSGLKSRPTSMVVVNEKKEKAKRKQEKSKSKDGKKEKETDGRRKSDRFKDFFKSMVKRGDKREKVDSPHLG
ncbi:hypothetical protein P154DRAFT_524203 [Amniculicola lignicola CBS 123094]|uniref:Uncharacterized protein n=1 Tax=Amniculicola lignicola CBS 123094 TaxID=1392246 RepID=A0A6A5W8P7_9PLEO|nr:hypothetical protein P154DRAFT_524203 [Amniculicola lignicola CBS 123094]